MARYLIVIEQGMRSWGAHVPDLQGCIAVGESRAEVVRLIHEAVAFPVEGMKAQGLPVPPPTYEPEVVEITTA
jgi:predicted RNase H-like HicB family nuclease